MDYFNKFTEEARKVLVMAQEEAKKMNLSYIGTEHLLLGVVRSQQSLGGTVLKNLGVTSETIYGLIQAAGPRQEPSKEVLESGLSDLAKKVIEDSVHVAQKYKHTQVGTEHILYALVSQGETAATIILKSLNVDVKRVAKNIEKLFSSGQYNNQSPSQNNGALESLDTLFQKVFGEFFGPQSRSNTPRNTRSAVKNRDEPEVESDTPALDYFTIDFTALAEQKKLDPVIGREKEVLRLLSILNRRTKNNPVLIGEPGVGKTAIVEGLAIRVFEGNVPEALLGKRILSLDLASVVAGTKYRGEFEERIKAIISEARLRGDVILFIDEMHTLIGAGSAEGTLDAANILKPALSRGEVQVIGATTTEEYRKYIEKDAAIERRFQPIHVDEPSIEDAIEIIRGVKGVFEDHHNLMIDDEAIEAAVTMSKRYISDRFLPDKAIDVMDEACALKGISIKIPENKTKKLKKTLEGIVTKKEEAVADQDYEKAARLREKELQVKADLQKELSTEKEKVGKSKIHIRERDIAEVIAQMTGVPAMRLMKSDVEKLKNLEKILQKHIIGQDEAIAEIAKAIRRSRVGIANPKRPIGSFIFIGPSGVGKTELVKRLAQEVYESEDALIKVDMSEFTDRHTASRLIGSPAGYVGHEEGGMLVNKVRTKPYSIILFDEIEKAHLDVLNILLQIMEDGELTDGKGKKANFRNCIIVMTSNIGANKLSKQSHVIGFAADSDLKKEEKKYEEIKATVIEELKKVMLPEFLNRVDKTIVFKPLTHAELTQIAKLQVVDLQERLVDQQLTLDVDKKVYDMIIKVGFDEMYGARPMRSAVRDFIEDPISEQILNKELVPGDVVKVRMKGEEIVVTK